MVSCSRKDILNANFTYEMIVIPIHWYAWQFAYSHDLIDLNEGFHFLCTGQNVCPILLRVEASL